MENTNIEETEQGGITVQLYRRYRNFILYCLVALAASAALLYLFVDLLSLHHLLGKLFATVIIVVCQFLFVKYFTFKKS